MTAAEHRVSMEEEGRTWLGVPQVRLRCQACDFDVTVHPAAAADEARQHFDENTA